MTAGPPLGHLRTLLDDTGVAQHATYGVVARAHGYCLDDNARGLLLAVSLQRLGLERDLATTLFARTAAFVQHAWNEEAGRFRNFMSYDRRWLEPAGSEDSHGRAVWVLGCVVRGAEDEGVRRWAAELLERSAPVLSGFTSPRALAFGLLGVVASHANPEGPHFADLRAQIAGRLGDHLRDSRQPDWCWFEAELSYDNARLSQAMLEAGHQAGRRDWLVAGLDTLRWLCRVSTAGRGHFSPVGSSGFWHRDMARARFDQQPIEAAAAVAAALSAWRVTGERPWLDEAWRAHAWFLGENDLAIPLVDGLTGGCRDGLHPDRANANQGAESTLAWLQADLDMQEASAPLLDPVGLTAVTG